MRESDTLAYLRGRHLGGRYSSTEGSRAENRTGGKYGKLRGGARDDRVFWKKSAKTGPAWEQPTESRTSTAEAA